MVIASLQDPPQCWLHNKQLHTTTGCGNEEPSPAVGWDKGGQRTLGWKRGGTNLHLGGLIG